MHTIQSTIVNCIERNCNMHTYKYEDLALLRYYKEEETICRIYKLTIYIFIVAKYLIYILLLFVSKNNA